MYFDFFNLLRMPHAEIPRPDLEFHVSHDELLLEPLEASFEVSRMQIALGPVLIMFALASAGIVAGGVLDKGRVVESGNHKELMANAGLYYKLYTLRAFEDPVPVENEG